MQSATRLLLPESSCCIGQLTSPCCHCARRACQLGAPGSTFMFEVRPRLVWCSTTRCSLPAPPTLGRKCSMATSAGSPVNRGDQTRLLLSSHTCTSPLPQTSSAPSPHLANPISIPSHPLLFYHLFFRSNSPIPSLDFRLFPPLFDPPLLFLPFSAFRSPSPPTIHPSTPLHPALLPGRKK